MQTLRLRAPVAEAAGVALGAAAEDIHGARVRRGRAMERCVVSKNKSDRKRGSHEPWWADAARAAARALADCDAHWGWETVDMCFAARDLLTNGQ